LTSTQTRESEHVLRLLEGRGRSLTFAVQYFLDHYREPETEKHLPDAINAYLDLRSRDEESGLISLPQYLHIRREMDRLSTAFSESLLGEVSSDDLSRYLGNHTISLKTWNNRRGYLNTFYRFCLDKDWRMENPVEKIPQHRIKARRGTAETLSAEQAESLMVFLEEYDGLSTKQRQAGATGKPGILVNFFALCLFAGVRPDWQDGEIGKLGGEHIDLDTGVIRIEPHVSKINERRTIKIQPNLEKWLKRYPLRDYPIIPLGIRRMYRSVRKKFKLGHDVLRHTYISMLVGKSRSVGDAALQAGNSEAVIRKYYLDVKSAGEAEKFWSVCPADQENKLVQFSG
jgi:integrase